MDRHDRAVFRERILGGDTTLETYATGAYAPRTSWEAVPLTADGSVTSDAAIFEFTAPDGSLRKTLRFSRSGSITAEYQWTAGSADDVFAV